MFCLTIINTTDKFEERKDNWG